jgi:rare lipoprotein A
MNSKNIFIHVSRIVVAGAFFLCTQRAYAPQTPPPAQPVVFEVRGLHNQSNSAPLAKPNAHLQPKPLGSWECLAGWYGTEFDGREMANGGTFDMNAPTAAHPTLPLGSIVRVIDLRTRLSQIVRITDRGPYVDGRGLDVSYGVARKLGFDVLGLARVRMELLEVPKRHSGSTPAD